MDSTAHREKGRNGDAHEGDEEFPIMHPSQAEGERRDDKSKGTDADAQGRDVQERPRPSQAEGERDDE